LSQSWTCARERDINRCDDLANESASQARQELSLGFAVVKYRGRDRQRVKTECKYACQKRNVRMKAEVARPLGVIVIGVRKAKRKERIA
jgi:hypothetical protein